MDLTQRHVEPLLVRFASHHQFQVRFSTEIVDVESVGHNSGSRGYVCTLHDHLTKQKFRVRTKYIFGADGARSWTARQFGFKFSSKSGGPKACNVLIRADLGQHLNKGRESGLHWIVQPDRPIFPGAVAHLRAVRPWNEWVLIAFCPDGSNPFEGLTTKSQEIADLVRYLVGDNSIDVQVLAIDHWTVRESVAESYSTTDRNVFILGDAAHRHPPTFGLGSNTSIQDAYNLAWKAAYVSKGLAGTRLLDSYSEERQPVGVNLVRESNNQIRKNTDLWGVLGMAASSAEERTKQLDELTQETPEGAARRASLHQTLEGKTQELESLGLAYNQWYTSPAVYLEDEQSPREHLEGDPVVQVQISTYPGSRLPHVFIDSPNRQKMISTIDLAGKGAFCLLVGAEGSKWRAAADKVGKATGIPINVFGIGLGQEFIDIYRDWQKKRGVGDDGCVLVRPDRFVAWRSPGKVDNYEKKLGQVLNTVLDRDNL